MVGQLDVLAHTVGLLEQRLSLTEDKGGQMQQILRQLSENQKVMIERLGR